MGGQMMHGRDLHKLGRELAEELDASRDGAAIARARARLVESGGEAPAASRRGFAFGGLALAAAAVVAVLAVGRGAGLDPAAPRAAAAGLEVVTREAAVPLALQDGARISIEPASRARVIAADPAGGALALEDGGASVTVPAGVTWRVTAGPHEVSTSASTGAAFQVSWSARGEVLAVTGGPVEVKSPDGRVRQVPATGKLRLPEP